MLREKKEYQHKEVFMITTHKGTGGDQPRRSEEVAEVLLLRLFRRGLLAAQLPRFLKDVLNVVEDEGTIPAAAGTIPAPAVNQRLARLGWGEEVLDTHTLDLILYLYEGRTSSVPLDALYASQGTEEIRAL
jgi:hypothetical protein